MNHVEEYIEFCREYNYLITLDETDFNVFLRQMQIVSRSGLLWAEMTEEEQTETKERYPEVTTHIKEITYIENGVSSIDLSAEETDGSKVVITPIDGTNMASVSTYKYKL